MKKYISILLMMVCYSCFSQENNHHSYLLEGSYFYGNIYNHNSDISHLIQGHPTGVFLSFDKKTFGLKEWQKKYNYNLEFLKGDVKKLPFENNSLGGYLSFGVVEHFIEGPQKPIEEAFRVLRPGGIAIISTPAPSWSKIYFSIIGFIKKRVKLLIGRTVDDKVFFQYEYTPIKLKKHVESIGFYISRFSGADWLYTFTEFGKNSDRFIKKGSFGYLLSHWFEHGILSFLGAQSIVIAIKKEKLMHCFLCGIKAIIEDSLKEFDVPICNGCKASSTAQYYKKGNIVSYGKKYLISSSILKPCEKDCDFCGNKYFTDELFEDFGFSKNVCMKCLNNKRVGFELSNTDIQPIWRSRGRR